MNTIRKAIAASICLLLPAGAGAATTITGDLQVTGIISSGVAVGVSAGGATLGTATALTFETNQVTTVAAGTGVRLPAGSTLASGLATTIEVWNTGANSLRVYPASTDAFYGTSGAGVPLLVGTGERMRFLFTGTGTTWSAAHDSLVFGPNSVAAVPGSAEFVVANGAGYPRLLTVLPGTYNLTSNVNSYRQNAWMFLRGATLTGAGRIDAVTDGGAVNNSGLALARHLAEPNNENVLFVSAQLNPTNGENYEKAGVYSRLLTADPSVDFNRDAVAFEGQVGIVTPNKFGRAWGINTGAGPIKPPNSSDVRPDGYAVGGEFGTMSYSGVDAGTLGTPTSKIAVHAVAYGENTSTAGLVLSPNGTTFLDGIIAQREAISTDGHAFSVRPMSLPGALTTRADDLAWITRDGHARFRLAKIDTLGITGNMASGLTFPLYSTAGDAAVQIGWNYANGGGAAEVDFVNNYHDATTSFTWFQRTGAGINAANALMSVSPSGNLQLAGNSLAIANPRTPASSSTACDLGTVSWDVSYIYVCISPNTWKRTSLTTW